MAAVLVKPALRIFQEAAVVVTCQLWDHFQDFQLLSKPPYLPRLSPLGRCHHFLYHARVIINCCQ